MMVVLIAILVVGFVGKHIRSCRRQQREREEFARHIKRVANEYLAS